jgi:uncharacterized membrane protein
MAASTRSRAFAKHDPRQARGRLVVAIGVGLLVATVARARLGAAVSAIAGWDAAALSMGVLAWVLIFRTDVKQTRRLAASEDPGRGAVWVIVILASVFSLFATVGVLRGARVCSVELRPIFVMLSLGAVASAWTLTHTAYTLRYAHLYYRDDGDGEGGLSFPGEQAPAYIDFAYYAFTIGMCFQTSDVTITSRQIRRATMAHAVLSFTYNTAILATAVSLVVGFFG